MCCIRLQGPIVETQRWSVQSRSGLTRVPWRMDGSKTSEFPCLAGNRERVLPDERAPDNLERVTQVRSIASCAERVECCSRLHCSLTKEQVVISEPNKRSSGKCLAGDEHQSTLTFTTTICNPAVWDVIMVHLVPARESSFAPGSAIRSLFGPALCNIAESTFARPRAVGSRVEQFFDRSRLTP
jgi:hypothetical protein